MISSVLIFLKDKLNKHLSAKSEIADGSAEEMVVFVSDDKVDPISFKMQAVSVLLINLEEEKTLRDPDRYARQTASGIHQRSQPDIHLNLYVLFAVRFSQYEQGLSYLSLIIRYFQANPVFNHQNAPELSADIEQLVLELITLPLSEQNDLWNALRTTYRPSVLYKVRTLVIQDENADATPVVQSIDRRVTRSS